MQPSQPDDPNAIDEADLLAPALGARDAAALGVPAPRARVLVAESRNRMLTIALIVLGAAIGASARYLLSQWVAGRFGTSFPYGTLIINITGSFLLGLVYTLLLRTNPAAAPLWRAFLGIGLLGGYTTFSSFSYETSQLLLESNLSGAIMNPLASVFGGIAACMLGIVLANMVVGPG